MSESELLLQAGFERWSKPDYRPKGRDLWAERDRALRALAQYFRENDLLDASRMCDWLSGNQSERNY